MVLTRDVPIHKFETVYQSIVRQLQGNFDGMGIRDLLTAWLDDLSPEFKNAKAEVVTERCTALAEELRDIPDMDINFANALAALVNNRFAPPAEGEDEESRKADREILMHWFDGGKVTKRELKPFQILRIPDQGQCPAAYEFPDPVLAAVRPPGVDPAHGRNGDGGCHERLGAQCSLRKISDCSSTTVKPPNTFISFFSIIPDVLVSEKGFKSYDALWSRVRSIGSSMGDTKHLNYRGVLVDIHQTPAQNPGTG